MANASKASFPERKKAAMYAEIDVWQGRAARLLVILLLCVQPLYMNPDRDIGRYFGLTYHKWVFFVASTVFVLLFVIVIWALRISKNPKILPQDKLGITDWAVLGFAVVTLLSTLLSPFRNEVNIWVGIPEPAGRYDGALTQLLYVSVFFIVSRWYRPNIKDLVFFGISASLVGLIGIFQFYGMDFFRLWPNHVADFRVDDFFNIFFRSTIGNVNILATFVCIAVLLCGFLYIRVPPASKLNGSKKLAGVWRQPLWLAASAINFWLMDIGGSDSALVGVLVTTFLAIPFLIENKKILGRALILFSSWIAVFTLQRLFFEVIIMDRWTVTGLIPFVIAGVVLAAAGVVLAKMGNEIDPEAPPKWRLGVILIAVFIVAGLVGVEVLGRGGHGGGLADRLLFETREVLHGNIHPEMGSGRVHIWQNALSVIAYNPIIGSGPDTFFQVFPEEAQGFMDARFDTAHNEYLQILVCQGVLGLLAYIVFLGGVFLKGIRKAFKNPLIMAVLAAFVGYGVQAFFNISLPIVSQILWVLAGMLASVKFAETPFEELS